MIKGQVSQASGLSLQNLYGPIHSLFKKNILCVILLSTLDCPFSSSDTAITCRTDASGLEEEAPRKATHSSLRNYLCVMRICLGHQ